MSLTNLSLSAYWSCSMFAPISRQEAELIQQQAPPSYGQLIAQGVIPPVEDFPTENPNEVSSEPRVDSGFEKLMLKCLYFFFKKCNVF